MRWLRPRPISPLAGSVELEILMVRWARSAEKDLDRLPVKARDRARRILDDVDQSTLKGKKLKGPLEGKYSVRLGRTHRIIYMFVESDVVVLTIGPRKDVYR